MAAKRNAYIPNRYLGNKLVTMEIVRVRERRTYKHTDRQTHIHTRTYVRTHSAGLYIYIYIFFFIA